MRTSVAPAIALLLLLGACAEPAPPTPIPGPVVPPAPRATIAEVQGRGEASAWEGRTVTVEGVVTGAFAREFDGVFIESLRDDGDPATSEGLFVERASAERPVLREGDRVRVTGVVAEPRERGARLTTLQRAQVAVLGHAELPLTELSAPPSDWERYEGMRLRIAAPLTVTGNDALQREGALAVSFGGRLFTPTEIALPGAAARAQAEANARRGLWLDDARRTVDVARPWYLPQPLGADYPLRAGSTITGVTGVLDQRGGRYRLQLTEAPRAIANAPRPPAPTVRGDLRLASFNVLNLFNGDGRAAGFPTPRGADTWPQYQRQRAKLVAAIQALAPDLAALMEIENDGDGADSSLAQLVDALNAAGPARDYRYVATGRGPGDDQIRVALIYRDTRVQPQGGFATLADGPFAGRSRPPLAQAFRAGRGPVFVVVANHLKSKGCGHEENAARGADADQHDGQGCWNALRLDSAQRLDAWVRRDPTGAHTELTVLLGDFNAYGQEDPLRWLRGAGWRDALAGATPTPYSFVFDGQAGRLDHALLSPALARRLRGAVEWHSNADEPEALDYHREDSTDAYRASDHDPLLVGLDLAR